MVQIEFQPLHVSDWIILVLKCYGSCVMFTKLLAVKICEEFSVNNRKSFPIHGSVLGVIYFDVVS